MRCQRRILGIGWRDMFRNVTVSEMMGLPPIMNIIDWRRVDLFGHVSRMQKYAPANKVLRIVVDVQTHLRSALSPSWKRPRGWPRDTWLKPLPRSDISIQEQWAGAIRRGHRLPARRLLPDM